MTPEETLMKDFEVLKRERTQLRRLFSTAAKKVEKAFAEDLEVSELKNLYAQFSDKATRLLKIEDSVSALLFAIETDESVISSEYDTSEVYRDIYSSIVTKWEEFNQLDKGDVGSVAFSLTGKRKKSALKLPKIVPYAFDGQLKNWISFWSVFKRIDESDEYDDSEKFQYLLMYTKEGSPSRELVESFPPLDKNYSKAVARLKARFGRDELLIEMYVRELLSLVLLQAKDEGQLSLRKLYDKLETQIKALESLGVASDKYTYLLTPLIESALPDQVLKDWERESKSRSDHDDDPENGGLSVKLEQLVVGDRKISAPETQKLQRLLTFLRHEVESEERRTMARNTFSDTSGKSKKAASGSKIAALDGIKESKPKMQTAAGLVNVKPEKSFSCVFCNSPKHASQDCVTAREKSREELVAVLKEKGHCFKCLRGGHSLQGCKIFVKCIICNFSHFGLLCKERKIPPKKDQSNPDKNGFKVENNLHSSCHSQVLMQTLRVRITGVPNLTARVLFDSGSQRSYITKSLVAKMRGVPTSEVKLEHALFGGAVSEPKVHKCYKIRLQDMNQNYSCNFDVLDAETICVAVPSVPIGCLLSDLEQTDITLSDFSDGPIDVLIGADVAGKLMTGKKRELENGLVAIQTHLGWTLMGKIPTADPRFMAHINLFSAGLSVQDLWRLETIGIEDSAQVKTREQKAEAAMEHFRENVKILESGRYEVKLPWADGHPPLPRNFNIALNRFESTYRKLKATSNVDKYFGVFQDWMNSGIIEEVPPEDWDVGHYLPHRPVFKEDSTTPIRPVFDASAKEKNQPSLNQCLEVGPNMVELIPSVLLRFREGKVGLVADVKRAFLQISVDREDRDFLRFIWRCEDGQLRIFRHTRVVFGVCSSPFLLGAVIDFHLNRCRDLLVETGLNASVQHVIEKLRSCVYVDNFVGSLNNENEIHDFIGQATALFSLACMDLRGWTHSKQELPDHPGTSVLGLIWDEKSDTIRINVPQFRDVDPHKITKKDLMSANHRLFDPIGFTSPTSVIPKKLIQDAWISGGTWETPIDEKSQTVFREWMAEIPFLNEIKIPRWLSGSNAEAADQSLHTFVDASQVAYAAVVFLRTGWKDNVNVQLVAAKTRVAPVQKVTIPRLELLAATVGARLAHQTGKVLPQIHRLYFWSDSTTALAWIKQEEPWAVFVRNRVQEIRNLSDPDRWRHVPGNLNPADLASRGCFPRTLMESKWWEGPTWLRAPETEWPNNPVEPNVEEVMKEKLKRALVTCIDVPFSSHILTKLMSQYWKILKVVGWMVRFRFNARTDTNKTRGRLTLQEIDTAEKWVIRMVQNEVFIGAGLVEINKLKPQRTADGLLRVRTKIWARKDSEDFRSPVILPSNHAIVEKLIYHVHCREGHIVGQHLLNVLRERFWLVKGRRSVKRVVTSCKVCQRFSARNLQTESPALPEDRVRDANVFEVTGTDYAGPLYLADGSKVWVCLFTCAIYRAVHLELVTSLSTECFVLAFRRFIARRGRPAVMYSDNGTNFRGMKNALDLIDWDKVVEYGNVNKIEWRFNPPSAAWWGGFWERMVRTLKTLLRKNLGRASLNYEELNTVLCDCESLINSRPLTYISEDPSEPIPITPQMFLQEIKEIGVPDCDKIDASSMNRRLKHRMAVQKELRQRFRTEYLGQLILTSAFGNTREPIVGELVFIGSDGAKRQDWPLGVIENVSHGKDGKIRVVQVRTAEGKLTRPIQRIFPLELDCRPEEKSSGSDTAFIEEGIGEQIQPEDLIFEDMSEAVLKEEASHGQQQLHHGDVSGRSGRKKPSSKTTQCEAKTRCGRTVKIPVRFQ